jgi:hypothetical protein
MCFPVLIWDKANLFVCLVRTAQSGTHNNGGLLKLQIHHKLGEPHLGSEATTLVLGGEHMQTDRVLNPVCSSSAVFCPSSSRFSLSQICSSSLSISCIPETERTNCLFIVHCLFSLSFPLGHFLPFFVMSLCCGLLLAHGVAESSHCF